MTVTEYADDDNKVASYNTFEISYIELEAEVAWSFWYQIVMNWSGFMVKGAQTRWWRTWWRTAYKHNHHIHWSNSNLARICCPSCNVEENWSCNGRLHRHDHWECAIYKTETFTTVINSWLHYCVRQLAEFTYMYVTYSCKWHYNPAIIYSL